MEKCKKKGFYFLQGFCGFIIFRQKDNNTLKGFLPIYYFRQKDKKTKRQKDKKTKRHEKVFADLLILDKKTKLETPFLNNSPRENFENGCLKHKINKNEIIQNIL